MYYQADICCLCLSTTNKPLIDAFKEEGHNVLKSYLQIITSKLFTSVSN